MSNFLGILIEERLSIGLAIVRIIKHDATKLIEHLRIYEYGVTIWMLKASRAC